MNFNDPFMLPTAHASFADLITGLPALASEHARTTSTYARLAQKVAAIAPESGFGSRSNRAEDLGEFGVVDFPYTRMGAVDTLDLFGLDELIIFAFYLANRRRYTRAADIGANLGLHSLLMARCGWQVLAYEPDPHHAELLRANLTRNGCTSITLREAAVSDRAGTLEFVRVLGNTTSSHLAGAKSNPYGALERFPVQVESICEIMQTVDFVKMDAEGQERCIILGTSSRHWQGTDMMVEVGSSENAVAIYAHLQKVGVNAFAQKLGWKRVTSADQMPTSYRDGSLFISAREVMPWS